MPPQEDITRATQRVEQAKLLIREAQSARQRDEPPALVLQNDIDRTRRMSAMMGNLAHLIEGMNDSLQPHKPG